MKKALFFIIFFVSIFSFSQVFAQTQCLEGDFPPDSYFQCIDGMLCQGDECISYEEVPETYIPSDNVLDSLQDEVWYQRQFDLWLQTQDKPCAEQKGCHPYTTCVTSYSVNSTGGCPGVSCGQTGRDLGIPGSESLLPWGKYEVVECVEPSPIKYGCGLYYYSYRIDRRLYSIADKCTSDNSSNQCLANNVGLWSGSCDVGSGNFYKCCCNNQTNNPVSSVPYYGETNDNHPPLEGVCPAGSRMAWENGASIEPGECAAICKPESLIKYHYSNNEGVCDYGTIEELGINPHLVTTLEQTGDLIPGLTKAESDYLCDDIYVCRDSTPVSVKGKYKSYDECVAGENLYCFEREDPVYESCSSGQTSEGDGVGFSYFRCSALGACFQTTQVFPSQGACEQTPGSKCYLYLDNIDIPADSCRPNCSSGLSDFWWCDGSNCPTGKYASQAECETSQNKTCYTNLNSCSAVCRTSDGSGSCSPLPSDSGSGLSLTISSDQCITEGGSTNINWRAETTTLPCGSGETLDRSSISISCQDICGDWTVSSAIGSDTVSPDYFSEYGLKCDLRYRCYEDVTDPDYSCECEESVCRPCGFGETCSSVCPGETHREYSDYHTASRSRKTEVRVVGKPSITTFTANPVDILYTTPAASGTQYSTLRWISRFVELGSPTNKSCTLQGNGVNFSSSIPTGDSHRVSPSKTTTYSLYCRNSDIKEPEQCFLDSDTKTATVRVFGARIEEQGPPAGSFKGLDELMGSILRSLKSQIQNYKEK